ncbi:MAG: ABC transporter permease subunit [Propionibacteriaceae bacterium]|nr:ABC transporter permease subunit [Propionibacteriaceae bacterium]
MSKRTLTGLNWGVILALVMFAVLLLGPYLAPMNPELVDLPAKLQGSSSHHWLGTDHLGRDILSRVLTGAQVTVGISFLALAICVAIGVPLGMIAGWLGGWLDWLVMRIADVFIALPDYVVVIVLSGLLGPGYTNLLIAIIVVKWVTYARLARSLVVQEKSSDYLQVTVLSGASTWRILTRHMIPHVAGPILALVTLDIGKVILLVASLSYIGMGVQPPSPEWGAMLNDGRAYFADSPQLMLVPGIAIFIVVVVAQWLGGQLQRRYALDSGQER